MKAWEQDQGMTKSWGSPGAQDNDEHGGETIPEP